jgi:hypothetical protein
MWPVIRSSWRRILVALIAAAVGVACGFVIATAASASSGSGLSSSPPTHGARVIARGFKQGCQSVSVARTGQAWCATAQAISLHQLSPADLKLRHNTLAHVLSKPEVPAHAPIMTFRPSTGPPTLTIIPPAGCDFFGAVVRNPDRFTSCSDTRYHLTLWEVGLLDMQPIGHYFLENFQWASYSASSATWTHGVLTLSYGGTGALTAGLEGQVTSACDTSGGVCTARSLTVPDPQFLTFRPESSYEFEWRETDRGPSFTGRNGINVLNPYLGIVMGAETPEAAAIVDNTGVLAGRCDSVVTAKDGCVNEDFTPTLGLSQAEFGSSAAMIKWAQRNLSAHWGVRGLGQPLHRLIGGREGLNRQIICGRGWKSDANITQALAPYKDVDSCDEFPFAGTYESGAMPTDVNGQKKPFVTTGADCAQVTAVQAPTSKKNPPEATVWNTVKADGTPSPAKPCVRGHIPNKLNGDVGRAYLDSILENRLINKDAFWVAVIP